MNKLKHLFTLAFLSAVLTLNAQSNFIREINYKTSKDENTADVREKAVGEIKRILMDEMGTYMVNQASHNVTEENMEYSESYKRKTQSFSMSLMKTKILEEKRRNNNFYVKVEIEIDENRLKNEMSGAGIPDNGNMLATVFKLLQEKNAPAVSIVVINTTNSLINDVSIFENRQSEERIYNVTKNYQAQILNGTDVLSGDFKIIYKSGSYVNFTLKNGYVKGSFERYSSDNDLIEKGNYTDNLKDGIWEYYVAKWNENYISEKIEYAGGMKNGPHTSYKLGPSNEVVNVTYYEDDVAVSQEIYEYGGQEVFKGPLDKYGKKEGEWIYLKGDLLLSKGTYLNDKKHGDFVAYYVNGNLSSEGSYQNGLEVGVHKSYYSNGQLEEERNYDQDGKRTGNTFQYYKDGAPKASFVTSKDNTSKQVLKYYPTGNVESEENYLLGDSFQKKHGKFVSYFESGNPKEEIVYDHNLKTGKEVQYFEDETLSKEVNYTIIDGKSYRQGSSKVFEKDGSLRSDENYQKDEFQGVQVYYSNGTLSKELEYDKGLVLWKKEYYTNGELRSHVIIPTNGKPVSEKIYYDNGQLQCEKQFLAPTRPGGSYSKKTGEYKEFSKTGTLLLHENYVDNQRNGLYLKYDVDGNVTQYKQYVNGRQEGLSGSYLGGKLKEFGEYKNNKKAGKWYRFTSDVAVEETVYDESGRKLSSNKYDDAGVREDALKRLKL